MNLAHDMRALYHALTMTYTDRATCEKIHIALELP